MRIKRKILSFAMVLSLVLSLVTISNYEVEAATQYTIDVNETLDLSCRPDTSTVRTKSSNTAVATVSDIQLSLDGGWIGNFTVTGVSEGTATITVYGVFNDVIYASYTVKVAHNFDSGVATTIATCDTKGVKKYTCSGCGYIKTEDLGYDSNNHSGSPILTGEKEASCGDGYTGDTVCSTCGYVYSYGTVIPAIGGDHTIVTDSRVEPGCVTKGLTEGSHCSVCQTVIVKQEILPEKGHTIVVDPAVLATKNQTGLTEGSHCSVCNAVLVEQQVIPMISTDLAHGVVDKDVTLANATVLNGDLYIKKGYTLTLNADLTVNGDVYIFGTLRNTKNLTVTGTLNTLHYNNSMSAGNYSYGYFYNTGKSSINKLNVTDSYLSKTVPAITHTWDSGKVTKAPSCRETGVKTYTCTTCEDTKTETINKTAHTYYWYHTETTGKDGYDLKCSVCNQNVGRGYKNADGYYYFYDFDNVDGLKHLVYDKDVKLIRKESCKAVTFTDNDSKTHETVCKCHLILNEEEAHAFNKKVTPATTKSDGTIEKTCKKCGYESVSYIKKIRTIFLKYATTTYTGKALKPTVTVKNSSGSTISSSNYTVTYTANKNVGTATATITFKGNYSGTVKKTFKINPKATTVKSVTPGAKKLTIKVNKQATQTTGYEVQVATDKKFKKGLKKATNSKNSATSLTIKSLKAKTKYYVRVRTYKLVGKTKYYSDWKVYSKTVKTK